MNDIEGFIPWAFGELKVDSLNIRRVSLESYAQDLFLNKVLKTTWLGLEDNGGKIYKAELQNLGRD